MLLVMSVDEESYVRSIYYCKLLLASKIKDLNSIVSPRDVETLFIIVFYFLNLPKTLLNILVRSCTSMYVVIH